MYDTSAFVGQWPFRNLRYGDPELLQQRLERVGITHAFVSPAETVLQRSPQAANRRWADQLADNPWFSFVPVVNPAQSAAAAVFDQTPSAAIRLMPGPHGYGLDRARELIGEAGERDIAVILQWRMIDVRMAHPDVVHRELTAAEIRGVADAHPNTRFLVAGARPPEIDQVLDGAPGNVWCDISHAEAPVVVRKLIASHGVVSLVCGTHAPIHVPEALVAKLAASDLTEDELAAIGEGNARRLFALA